MYLMTMEDCFLIFSMVFCLCSSESNISGDVDDCDENCNVVERPPPCGLNSKAVLHHLMEAIVLAQLAATYHVTSFRSCL